MNYVFSTIDYMEKYLVASSMYKYGKPIFAGQLLSRISLENSNFFDRNQGYEFF